MMSSKPHPNNTVAVISEIFDFFPFVKVKSFLKTFCWRHKSSVKSWKKTDQTGRYRESPLDRNVTK